MLKQYQNVLLNRDSLVDNFLGEAYELRRGQQGMIMAVYEKTGIQTGYDVEFFDENGDTVALVTLPEPDLLPLEESTSKSSRQVA